jgi:hypothetical protein
LAGLGRHGEARDALHESLAIRRDIGDLHGQLRGLWVASAQAADSEPERASGWLGAADEARRSAAIERSRADDALVGAIQSALRARLGEGEYDRAVEEGTRTRLAAAMADALEWSAGGGPSQPAAGRR